MLGETYNHHNTTTTMSSIALLQERFRQLQKMKEMRQEKELIRFLSESDRYSPPITQQPPPPSSSYNTIPRPITSQNSQLVFVSADPELTLTLSLWPAGSQVKNQASYSKPNPDQSPFRKTWFADQPSTGMGCGSMMKHEQQRCETDIDTSLHL